MDEKLFEAKHELSRLQECFGEKAEIQEIHEGYSVKAILESGELEGGQTIELTLGIRTEIPIDLKQYDLILSGIPIQTMKINNKTLEGYNFYTSPVNEKSGMAIAVANFAEPNSRSIIISYLKKADDIATLFHEIGHIKEDHTMEKRSSLLTKVKENPNAQYPRAVFDQEIEANNSGLEALRDFDLNMLPSDPNYKKVEQYLEKEVKKQYIETGEQSAITDLVLEKCDHIPGEGLNLIRNITAFQQSFEFRSTQEPVFSRTIDEIIQSHETLGCQESGLILITILRAKGETASFIQAFNKDDLINYDEESKDNRIRGHVFIRWTTDEGFKIINSTTGEITEDIPETFVIGGEGLDAWDIGLKDGIKDYLQLFEKTKTNNNL